jgi:long-subunit acyl-CoA synthetase (AMP-forming)
MLKTYLFKAYGMTETTGGHALNKETEFRFEAAGHKREGIHTKIIHPDEDQQGEVRHSFQLMLYVKCRWCMK